MSSCLLNKLEISLNQTIDRILKEYAIDTTTITTSETTPDTTVSFESSLEKGQGQGQIVRANARTVVHRKTLMECITRIIDILLCYPTVVETLSAGKFYTCMRCYLSDSDTSIRTIGLRCIRKSLTTFTMMQGLLDNYIHIYVVISLERESKFLYERMEAIKLIKRIIETDSSRVPASIVRSLIAICTKKEDSFRRIGIETIRELAFLNISILAQCNGIQAIIDPILDPACHDLSESLLYTLVFILNDPFTRQFIRPSLDLQVLFAPFTDTDAPPGNERRQKWSASKEAIVLLMRTWTGIIYLTSSSHGLKTLVDLLMQPTGVDVKKYILDMLCEILNISSPFKKTDGSETKALEFGGASNHPALLRKKMANPTGMSSSIAQSALNTVLPHNLLDNYSVIILLSLFHCGLVDALVQLGIGANRELTSASTEVLTEMLRISSQLLPEDQCASLLALPALVDVASTFSVSPTNDPSSAGERSQSIRSSEILAHLADAIGSSILSYNTDASSAYVNGVHFASEVLLGTNRPSMYQEYPGRTKAYLRSGRNQIMQELKKAMDAQMADATFKDMLHHRSKVLLGKDWFKWDWEIITELLEGPLTTPARLSEAMKTKFFQRLSGFFRCDPGNKGFFAQLPWIPDYVPYVRSACQMYTLLLSQPEGLTFLKTDRRGQLLSEIARALELEARPEAAIVESHIGALQARMFSPEFCSRRMLREYFTLLGLMSSSKEGLALLEESNLFQRLYAVGKSQSHDFLSRLILANLDYSVPGASRNLLELWIHEGSRSLRLYATCLLRALLRSNMTDFASWGIDILVTQLHQEEEIAEAALSVLEEAALTPDYLLAMILKRPQKLIELPSASNLLLKFLSLPEGLLFLKEMGTIPKFLHDWRSTRYLSYVHAVEERLAHHLTTQEGTRTPYSLSMHTSTTKPWTVPLFVPTGKQASGVPSQEMSESTPWELDWLFRLPWNMEVKIVGPTSLGPPLNVSLDTFVDASCIRSQGSTLGESECVSVKGIVVDAKNMPQPIVVNAQQSLQACLFLGTRAVDRYGATHPAPRSQGDFVMSQSGDLFKRSLGLGDKKAPEDTTESFVVEREEKGAMDSEDYRDWSICHPEQRSADVMSTSDVKLNLPGEHAQWSFKVENHTGNPSRPKRILLKSVEFSLQLLPPRKKANVALPPHLYGELAKTNAGCDILKQSGHMHEFVSMLGDPTSVPLAQRAALWVLGHVAATSRGFDLVRLAKSSSSVVDFFDRLLEWTCFSPLLSLRGTCFYVLGLISRCALGKRYLQQHGWQVSQDARQSIVVPRDVDKMFSLPTYVYRGSSAVQSETYAGSIPLPVGRQEWTDVLNYIGNLSSHIHTKEARHSLKKLKVAHPSWFASVELYLHVHHLLERYSFRLQERQFIHALFEDATLTNAAWHRLGLLTVPTSDLKGNESFQRRGSCTMPSFSSSIQTLSRPSHQTASSSSKSVHDQVDTLVHIPSTQGFESLESLFRAYPLNGGHFNSKYHRSNHSIEFIGAKEAVV